MGIPTNSEGGFMISLRKVLHILILIFSICPFQNISNAEEYKFKKPISPVIKNIPIISLQIAPFVTDPGEKIESETEFIIRWTKVEGATYYDTQLAIDPNFTKRLLTSGTINTEQWFFKEVEEVTTYYFRCRAKNNAGTGPWSNVVDIIVVPPPEFILPTIAPVVTDPGKEIISETELQISWTKVDGTLVYDYQTAIDYSFTKRVLSSTTTNTYTWIFKTVDEVTTYYFRCRAKNNAGTGPWSNVVDITVIPEK